MKIYRAKFLEQLREDIIRANERLRENEEGEFFYDDQFVGE